MLHFSFYDCGRRRHLHSFPTRRSSDLAAERRAKAGGFREARDLAMLELFYSTGIRLAELAGLNQQDVDLVSDQVRSEEHTSELQSLRHLVCRLLLEKKKKKIE